MLNRFYLNKNRSNCKLLSLEWKIWLKVKETHSLRALFWKNAKTIKYPVDLQQIAAHVRLLINKQLNVLRTLYTFISLQADVPHIKYIVTKWKLIALIFKKIFLKAGISPKGVVNWVFIIPTISFREGNAVETRKQSANIVLLRNRFHAIWPSSVLKIPSKVLRVKWWITKHD